jgi:hypothetical protein
MILTEKTPTFLIFILALFLIHFIPTHRQIAVAFVVICAMAARSTLFHLWAEEGPEQPAMAESK